MISVSPSSTKQLAILAQHIKAKATGLEENVDEKLRVLADEAKVIADAGYELATTYGVKSHRLPKVYVDKEDNGEGDGWLVIASGREVMFLEFGAGVDTDTDHAWTQEMPFKVEPGSWSEDHAKQFSEKGYWFYDGKLWHGIPATRALYNASLAVRQKIESGEWLNDEVKGE